MDDLDTLLSLVENPTRRRILESIVREPSYPLRLSKELGVSQQAVMKNLALMEQNGLVVSYRESSRMGPDRTLYVPNTEFTLVVEMHSSMFSARVIGPSEDGAEVPAEALDILDDYMGRFYEWNNYRKCLPAIEDLKTAITERVLTYPEVEEDLDPEELVELAVGRAVDLLTGGLKEHISPEDLERCVGKIKVHTAVKSRERESSHDRKRIPFPAIC